MPACLICSASPSSDTRELFASCASRSFILRYCAMPLALSRSAITRKVSPASGMPLETQDLDRRRRPGFLDRPPAIVEHRAHLAERVADDVAIARPQRSVLHQNRRHRTASTIQLGFDDRTNRGTLRRSLLLVHIRHQADHLFQQIEVEPLLGRHLDELRVSAPSTSACTPRVRQLLLHPVGSASGLSILFTATMIGTFAAFAWSIASSVCGITPSSAATTTTTMSVIFAPRARIRVNAS